MRRQTAQLGLWGITVLALVCGFAEIAAAQKGTAKENPAVAAARDLDKQLIAAFNARDLDKQMTQYWNSPELTIIGEDGQVKKGWEAAKKGGPDVDGAVESVNLPMPDCQYWASGDGVLAACAYTMAFKLKGGPAINSAGWYTNFRRKIGGKWLIVYENVSANAPAPPGPNESLYKRLGGYDALAAVSDDFLGRLAADQRLGQFFKGVSKAHVQSIRQHVVDFLCMATGGPCIYAGRDMKSTHAGLGITNADWDRMAGFLIQTFDKFHVPERERKEVLGALGGLKADIVDKPQG